MLNINNSSIIYISSKFGDDVFDGFSPVPDGNGSGPIRTIYRLEQTINSLRIADFARPISVRFIGDYELDKQIELGAELVSGIYGNRISLSDITFESYGNEPARIIGGKILKGFKKDVFNGVECISLYIPQVKNGEWRFTDLYVNGKPAKVARYPKNSTLKAITTENPDKWALDNGSKWFVAFKDDLKNIDGIEDAIVSFNHFWIDEHSPVESYDRDTGKLVLKYCSRFMITVNYSQNSNSALHYYLENIPTFFSDENEWYLDVKHGMLYYIPEKDCDIDNLEIIAPTVKHFINVCGTNDNKVVGLRFRNLKFIATKGDYVSISPSLSSDDIEQKYIEYASDSQSCFAAHGAFRFENSESCTIENCDITCAGVHAIEINKGCRNIRIENCRITNCGGGGIKILGSEYDDIDLRPTQCNIIRKNIISDCGKHWAAGCGILICHSSQNEISENEISNLEYSGISVGWVWGYKPSSTYGNLIKNNHIHHIGKGRLSDMGGIYLLGRQHGTVVSGNVVHDVTSSNYGGMGIYTDEGASYITIENNVVYRCKDSCYQHHYGMYNTVRGNVFAFAGKSLIEISRREDRPSVLFEENIFISEGEPVYLTENGGFLGSDIASSNNTVWDISGKEPLMHKHKTGDIYLKKWQDHYGFDKNSKNEKPSEDILNSVR